MKLSLLQMNVVSDLYQNLDHAKELSLKAVENGADVIILPEMFCCEYKRSAFLKYAQKEGGEVTNTLSKIAADTGAYLIGGSMPEFDDGRLYNTCFVFDPSGKRIARHRKIHLFDVDIDAGQRYRESDSFAPGSEITTFDTPFGKFGVCICFDIRFNSFIHRMSGIDFLAVPAAFNITTGPLHWELLFRARAVDEQVFTFGCAPARNESSSYVSYANSIAVSPWGRVLAIAGSEEAVLTVEIEPNEVREMRRQIPLGKA